MKKTLMIVFILMFNGCTATVDSIYQAADITFRPPEGYNRNTLFNPYITRERPSDPLLIMCKELKKRTDWNAQSSSFRSVYPRFNVELLAINQYSGHQTFSWRERLILSDALELLTFAINSPIFEQEMKKIVFYNNTRDKIVPSDEIIRFIRDAAFKISIAKSKLPSNVVAEATIGGYFHTILLRDDQEYQKHNVANLAMVLGHELTHNLGFLHSSNVPHGVHGPILTAISNASEPQTTQFIAHTPYFENDFLSKVRVVPKQTKQTKPTKEFRIDKILDYESDFK